MIAGGLGALFYSQKHHEAAPVAGQTTAAAQSTPHGPAEASPRPVSEHNWMKRSLDRATEVRDKSRTQTQQSQDP